MLTDFIARFGAVLEAVKNDFVFFCLLPLKVGFSKAVSEFTWGFDLTPPMLVGYWIVSGAAVVAALATSRWRLAVVLGLTAWLLFFGTTGVAWPGFVLATLTLAFCAGSWPTAAFTAVALAFVIGAGAYDKMMESLYLCILAVAISLIVGMLAGVAAAYNRHVSAILRPIEDTLQTMPQFVLLIPALMLFQVGEFTALIAIVLYAVVPAARYAEAALRGVDHELVEAAEQMGASRLQVLFGVKLPASLPTIMLGINQTILFGVSMLVIAALVGTRGLALDVYLALSHADAGRGLVAGLAIAMVAMVADRIIHAFVARARRA
jgi:glycine betaine/proline transport system permease protein